MNIRHESRLVNVGVMAALTLGLLARAAHAADAPAPAPPAAEPPAAVEAGGDVVRLKNGGLVRGKISELVPGESVTIVTLTGKTRDFSMSEVEYAGPEADAPSSDAKPKAPAPAADAPPAAEKRAREPVRLKPHVTVISPEARLRFQSEDGEVTFHRQTDSAIVTGMSGTTSYRGVATGYERVCTTPCTALLPAGTETFALSREDGSPVAAESVTLPPGNSLVTGTIESRSGIRVAGWVILAASVIGGGALILTASTTEQECSEITRTCRDAPAIKFGQVIGGLVVIGVGSGVGIVMGLTRDKASVDVQSGGLTPRQPLARGLTLHGSF